MLQELEPESLRAICDDSCLNFETTGDLRPLQTIIGQRRAVQALEFGLGIGDGGFNIYAAGPPGTGKTTAITAFLEEHAQIKEPPSDRSYDYNYADPSQP
ncbi:MAG: AAA family ATPase, partial [Chloroflexi bacterium]|nr:AAA family ATPase [Chloroflexota bacterium]